MNVRVFASSGEVPHYAADITKDNDLLCAVQTLVVAAMDRGRNMNRFEPGRVTVEFSHGREIGIIIE